MLSNILSGIPIVLGSQSPRRRELLTKMGLTFEVIVNETDESFDASQSPEAIVKHIAVQKIKGFSSEAFKDALVITADTVVVLGERQILGKPKDALEALTMLRKLQGGTHRVMTAVAIQYQGRLSSFVEVTEVTFYALSEAELQFYIKQDRPFDKAGGYGIQEWIGFVGIQSIKGSYENVVGLPTARLYQELKKLGAQ